MGLFTSDWVNSNYNSSAKETVQVKANRFQGYVDRRHESDWQWPSPARENKSSALNTQWHYYCCIFYHQDSRGYHWQEIQINQQHKLYGLMTRLKSRYPMPKYSLPPPQDHFSTCIPTTICISTCPSKCSANHSQVSQHNLEQNSPR